MSITPRTPWHYTAMMTSSNGNIFRVTGTSCGEFTGHRWIPLTKASAAELWRFFDLLLNKRLSKQSWGWWFETPSCPLWRHCDVFNWSFKSLWSSDAVWDYRTLTWIIACRLTSTETLGLIFGEILIEIQTFSLKCFSAQLIKSIKNASKYRTPIRRIWMGGAFLA